MTRSLIPLLAIIAGYLGAVSGTANAAQFTYAYSICKDGTVRSCGAGHTQSYCESKCSDHEGLAKRFYTTLEVPYKYRRSPETWREGLEESYAQALQHYEEVLQPLLEAQRKAKEDARKAKEAAKEKERKDCLAKMTYPVKVWACPGGNFASEPESCKKDNVGPSMAEHAVEVDLGFSILPPGESCAGRTYWKDVTHADQLKYQLDKANDPCNSHISYLLRVSDEEWEKDCSGKTSSLYLASEKARSAWYKVNAAWRQTLPYDCLAGVCLNTPATRIADKLVTVSEVVMHRKVEVCSGRVVEVDVWASWVIEGYGKFVDVLPGAQHRAYGDGGAALNHYDQIRSEMITMGWVFFGGDALARRGYSENTLASHDYRKGWRSTDWDRGGNGGSWYVSLTTEHPDKDALCASKRQEGL